MASGFCIGFRKNVWQYVAVSCAAVQIQLASYLESQECIMSKYQSILMAAGVGSRISAHTNLPKSTLTLSPHESKVVPSRGDDTIIAHTLSMLEKKGFRNNLVVGYRKEHVKDMLEGFDVRYFENPYYRITNSIASLWFAKSALLEAAEHSQDVVLGNADVFWGETILDLLLDESGSAIMLADRSRVEVGDYFFKVDDDGILLANGKDLAVRDRNCEYVGIAKLSASFIPAFVEHLDSLIWEERYNMWWEDVLYSYKQDAPVRVLDVDGRFWGEVDTLDDYHRIVSFLAGHPEELR